MQQNPFDAVDPPRQLPTQPQSFPGVVAPKVLPYIPRVANQEQRAAEDQRLAREAAEREAIRLGFASAAEMRAARKEERDAKKAELTGGVDTTEAENTAAFLTTQLTGHVNKINDVLKDHPEAIKPGWAETIGGLFGERARAIATPDKVQDVRNQLNNRYSLAADVLLTLGTGAAYTAEQKKAYVESYSPKVTDGPETLADKREMMREAVIAARAKSGAAVGQIDRALAEIDKLYTPDAVPETTAEGKKELSTETTVGKLPKGYIEDHAALMGKYPPGKLTVQDYMLIRRSLADSHGGWGLGLDPKDAEATVEFYNKTGRVPRPDPGEVKLNKEEQEAAKFSSSELGTGAANFANALTLGGVDLAVGQEGRELKDLASEENWKSALAGEVAGSLLPMAGIERAGIKALEKLGMSPEQVAIIAPKIFGKELRVAGGRRRLASDAATNAVYGGARGFAGANEGEGLEGTLTGIGAGALGAGAGQLVTKGVTPILSDATAAALEATKGIKKTTLQRLGLGKAESSLSGVPGTHGAREASFKSFNRDVVTRALSHIGVKVPKKIQPGTEMNTFMNKELNNAYNAIRPKIVGAADKQFDSEFAALQLAKADTPEKKAMFEEIENAKKLFLDENGHYSGKGYKEASERLRFLQKTWANKEGDVAAGDMSRVAEQARKQMQFLIQRKTPEVGARLKKLERAWAQSVRIEDAAERAVASTEDAIFSPSQYLSSIKKLESQRGAVARGKSLDQPYAMAAQKVLGSGGVPKLSPLQTSMVLGVVGGSGFASPAIPAVIGTVAAGLYGPGPKQIVQAILSGKRPSAADNEIIRRIIEDASRHEMTGD